MKMRKIFFVCRLFLFAASFVTVIFLADFPVQAATFFGENPEPGLHEELFRKGSYLIYLPPGYDPSTRYPLVVLSHMNEGGTVDVDPEDLIRLWMKPAEQRGYIVAMPLVGGVPEMIDPWYDEVLSRIEQLYSVDRKRILLTGLGGGAHYALHLALTHPEEFTGVSPVAGTFEGLWTGQMQFRKGARPAFYFLAGRKDTGMPAEKVRQTVDEMRRGGYSVQFEIMEGIGHEYPDKFITKVANWFDSLPNKITD